MLIFAKFSSPWQQSKNTSSQLVSSSSLPQKRTSPGRVPGSGTSRLIWHGTTIRAIELLIQCSFIANLTSVSVCRCERHRDQKSGMARLCRKIRTERATRRERWHLTDRMKIWFLIPEQFSGKEEGTSKEGEGRPFSFASSTSGRVAVLARARACLVPHLFSIKLESVVAVAVAKPEYFNGVSGNDPTSSHHQGGWIQIYRKDGIAGALMLRAGRGATTLESRASNERDASRGPSDHGNAAGIRTFWGSLRSAPMEYTRSKRSPTSIARGIARTRHSRYFR